MQERMEFAGHAHKQQQSAQPQIRQLTEDEIAQGCKLDPCIGMRVERLWPEVSTELTHMPTWLPLLAATMVPVACVQWQSLPGLMVLLLACWTDNLGNTEARLCCFVRVWLLCTKQSKQSLRRPRLGETYLRRLPGHAQDGGWFEGVVTDYSALDRTHW